MSSTSEEPKNASGSRRLGRWFGSGASKTTEKSAPAAGHSKWSFGVLNDPETVEVPGSVLLLAANRNEPLGLRNVHARTSHSSIPAGFAVDVPLTPGGSRPAPQTPSQQPRAVEPTPDPNEDKKKTDDGTIILDPQPEESSNDPLNWPSWRRNSALLSLGFYCMIGGGITSLMAAGFTNIADDLDVSIEDVSLTVGLYMMGLGLGSVVASPSAILYGKRPVYLASAIVFIATCIWAGKSKSFGSLVAARVFQGVAVSPVECLPSATIAEIFFLHERAYRIGIYTLLLLGGKNLIPLVSAAIIGAYGWRWVFYIVAMVAALGFVLLFLFAPETFWDRTPTRKPSRRPSFLRRLSSRRNVDTHRRSVVSTRTPKTPDRSHSPGAAGRQTALHVGFAETVPSSQQPTEQAEQSTTLDVPQAAHTPQGPDRHLEITQSGSSEKTAAGGAAATTQPMASAARASEDGYKSHDQPATEGPVLDTHVPLVHLPDEPSHIDGTGSVYTPLRSPHSNFTRNDGQVYSPYNHSDTGSYTNTDYFSRGPNLDNERIPASALRAAPKVKAYTHNLRQQPPKTFVQQLKPYHGRLNSDKWFKVMLRPFVLYSYPAVLWSAAVYACSIGWLIVISETMAIIYRDPTSYNFDALQAGLVYISPFVGGVLGTGVAGKISDIIVRAMARRNGGLYEPEFRLVMALPIMITTCIGLMGFGWSAQEKDHWIVPTAFFGVLSFGCSLGSTTSITFCVDSYRQYAGEALVTLNFTKNVLHGLVFSLFVSHWMAKDGPKDVYMWLGIIQLILQLTTIPLFIYGKRARMWTARKNLMEKL